LLKLFNFEFLGDMLHRYIVEFLKDYSPTLGKNTGTGTACLRLSK